VQELTLANGHDLQMRLEQRKIPRPQRHQETIASMLVLWSHADFHRRCRPPTVYLLLRPHRLIAAELNRDQAALPTFSHPKVIAATSHTAGTFPKRQL
jgi:hypothetical protein